MFKFMSLSDVLPNLSNKSTKKLCLQKAKPLLLLKINPLGTKPTKMNSAKFVLFRLMNHKNKFQISVPFRNEEP